MEFKEIAEDIVRKSIKSSIYIDDQCFTPLHDEWRDYRKGKALYKSFQENNCSIQFYPYTKDALPHLDLTNKDLVILDWNLEPEALNNFEVSFSILERITIEKNIHFCCIYTNEDQERDGNIIAKIFAHFSNINSNGLVRNDIEAFFIQHELDWDIELLKSISKEFLIYEKERGRIKAELREKVFNNNFPVYNEFINFLEPSLTDKTEKENIGLFRLCYIINEWPISNCGNKFKVKFSYNGRLLQIDDLLVFVLPKSEEDGSNFYNTFSDAVSSSTNIFLTLFGLEMKNLSHQIPSFISGELVAVEEDAFFYHRNKKGNYFHDFLREIWRDHSSSFLLRSKSLPLLENIDNYLGLNDGLNKKLNNFSIKNLKNYEDLACLNLIYNRANIVKGENDAIGFGDIFTFVDSSGDKYYALCLTPLCDCLEPSKMNFNFYFVLGQSIGMPDALKRGESDYISYIKEGDSVNCVRWVIKDDQSPKPFTLYIPARFISSGGSVKTYFCCNAIELFYNSTLKENYTQRMANFAFNYPLRVGIDFASFDEQE